MRQNRSHSAETEARSALADATAGVVGALVATLAFYPMDVYKTNLQANRNNSTSSSSSSSTCLRTQCCGNGTKGWKEWIHTIQRCRLLFRGLHYKVLHTSASSFCYFFLYSWIQSRYHRLRSASASTNSAPPSVAARLILSGLAAMINTLLTLPLDVWSAQSQTITATTTTTTSTASTTETKPVIPTAMLLESKCEDDTTTNTMTTTESTTSPKRNKHALVLMNDVWTQVNNHSNHNTSNANHTHAKNRNGPSPSLYTTTSSSSEEWNHSSPSSSHYSPAYGTERGSILLSVMTSSDGYATPDEDEDDNAVTPLTDGYSSSFAFPSSPSLTALCWSGHQEAQPISHVPLLNHDVESTNDMTSRSNDNDHDDVAVSNDVSTTSKEPQPHWTDGWKGLYPALLLCSNPAIHYTVFDMLKASLLQRKSQSRHTHPNQQQRLQLLESFGLGLVAKSVSTLLTYPLIRAKVLMMCHSSPRNESLWNVLRQIFAQDGVAGLYKGCNMQLLLTMLKSALLMMVRERITITTRRLFLPTPSTNNSSS
eukprot:CAMPEP_0198286582 /NCGR_PEP_ID=MMETSP1449-20131203/5643_1 /TAXON_ID=420275 /ORGANISM="Attheya septentrionalis, Strain CCMP2084" /LENGTH=538 /DNA_ID=CAMNT_0043984367 /DNA_START=167 /DNA_END=1783 /DNA_ORIENTATION=+